MTLEAYIQGIKDRARDIDTQLEDREWEECLIEALAQYDTDVPLELTAEETGAGTDSLDLPADWQADWGVLGVTSSDEELQSTDLEVSNLVVLRTDGNLFSVGVSYTLFYTRPRTVTDVSGIPSAHCAPVTDLAAAKVCRRLAAVYMKTKDTSIGAEIINFQRKWDEHLRLADVYETQYSRAIHGTEKVSEANAQPIAAGFVTWSLQT